MFLNLKVLLQSDTTMKCNFTQRIASHLNAVFTAIEQYFLDIERRHQDLWISKSFSIEESCICDDDMAAKVEFLEQREDSRLEIDFATIDIGNFWLSIQHEYPIISRKTLSFLIQCSSTYCCEVGFSTMASIKTKYQNKLVIDNDVRCSLSSNPRRFDSLIAQNSITLIINCICNHCYKLTKLGVRSQKKRHETNLRCNFTKLSKDYIVDLQKLNKFKIVYILIKLGG